MNSYWQFCLLAVALSIAGIIEGQQYTPSEVKVTFNYAAETSNPDRLELTWKVEPAGASNQISAFHIQYAEDTGSSNPRWTQQRAGRNERSTTIYGLQPDTAYLLKFETEFNQGTKSESKTVRFKTSAHEPISNVEVSHDTGSNVYNIRWTLASQVDRNQLIGYKVVYTENDQEPETEWSVVQVSTRDTTASLSGLRQGARYALRIHPRRQNGNYITSRTTFYVTTMSGVRRRRSNGIKLMPKEITV